MHFVTFCSLESAGSNSIYEYDAEMAVYAHPAAKNSDSFAKAHASNACLPTGISNRNASGRDRHDCIFYNESLSVNPFTSSERLDVFQKLSEGRAVESCCTTRDTSVASSLSPSSNSSVCGSYASTPVTPPHATVISRKAQMPDSLNTLLKAPFNPMESASECSQPLSTSFSYDSYKELKCKPYSGALSPGCDERYNQRVVDGKAMCVEEARRRAQRSNCLASASHPYYNERTSTNVAGGRYRSAVHNTGIFSPSDPRISPMVGSSSPFLSQRMTRMSSYDRDLTKSAEALNGYRTIYLDRDAKTDSRDNTDFAQERVYDFEKSRSFLEGGLSFSDDEMALAKRLSKYCPTTMATSDCSEMDSYHPSAGASSDDSDSWDRSLPSCNTYKFRTSSPRAICDSAGYSPVYAHDHMKPSTAFDGVEYGHSLHQPLPLPENISIFRPLSMH